MFASNLKYFLTLTLVAVVFTQDLAAEPSKATVATTTNVTADKKQTKKRPTRGIASESNAVKEANQALERAKTSLRQAALLKRQAEARTEMHRRRVERYLDRVVVEFLLDTHIEGAQTCNKYKSIANGCLRSPEATSAPVAVNGSCDELLDVPEILAAKWNDRVGDRGNYCVGNSRENAGSVSPELCSDQNLHVPSARRTINASECSKTLVDYRKARIELANAADNEERVHDELVDRERAIIDITDEQAIENMRDDD